MKLIGFRFTAAASVLVGQALVVSVVAPFLPVLLAIWPALPVRAATRPHYGGTLRLEMRARLASLDPREWPSDSTGAAAADRLASLIFERLVTVNENGRVQPALAVSWQYDAESKRWQFRLRPGVKFHDGTPLTPDRAAAALQPLLGEGRLVRASGEWLVIQSLQSMPDLPAELARGRHFIFRVTSEGLAGTGAFRIAEWQPRRRLLLAANEDCWAGRPFLDSIAVEMGVHASEQLIHLELGKADLVELSPDQVRRASQSGARTWSSAPAELLALVFALRRPAVQEVRLRRAVALSIDRGSIVKVLLQNQGEVAGGLLPQWLSGYAFLFPSGSDVERAKQLRSGLSAAAPLALVYDSDDALARAVAERVAVNARAVGIPVQVSGAGSAAPAEADVRLIRLRLASTDPRAALESLLASLGEPESLPPAGAAPEQLYAAERTLVESFRVVPLAHLAETYGLGPQVKNWMPRRWGGWRLEALWLDTSSQAAAGGDNP